MKTLNKKQITLQELGLYIKVIKLDYNPKTNKELAKLISEHFNVVCKEKDVNDYEKLYLYHQNKEKQIVSEDFEFESRKQEFNLNL